MGAILQMLQSRPGGMGGVLSSFEQGGLGGVAQSWIGGGQNQPVSPGQVQNALGPDAVSDVLRAWASRTRRRPATCRSSCPRSWST